MLRYDHSWLLSSKQVNDLDLRLYGWHRVKWFNKVGSGSRQRQILAVASKTRFIEVLRVAHSDSDGKTSYVKILKSMTAYEDDSNERRPQCPL